jgi:hypothetical protein
MDYKGLFTADLAGMVSIRAYALDGTGVSDDFDLSILESLGYDNPGKDRLVVWPNPGAGRFYLNLSGLTVKQLRILSNDGRIIQLHMPREGTDTFELDLSEHPPGFYLVWIDAVQGSFHAKLMYRK